MVSKKNPDDYQLPEDDFGTSQDFQQTEIQVGAPKGNPLAGLLRHKKILIGLGLIIAVIIVYEFTGNKQDESQIQPQTQIQMTQPKPAAQAPQTTVESSQIASLTSQNESLKNTLSTLTNQSNENKTQLSQLETGLTQLVNNQRELNDQVEKITANLQYLSSQVEQLMPKPKPKKSAYTPPPPVYHLKAVLPGRAWLESQKGDTITVAVGDKVQGYGTVTVISDEIGAVKTSSGKIIRYGVNDY